MEILMAASAYYLLLLRTQHIIKAVIGENCAANDTSTNMDWQFIICLTFRCRRGAKIHLDVFVLNLIIADVVFAQCYHSFACRYR
jgi:hypothetical protein